MAWILSHGSALEVMRLWDRADQASRRADVVVPGAPSVADAERWAASNELLRALTRPLDLLVSSREASRRNRLFRTHALTRPLPGRPFVQVGEQTFVSSPELVLLQMASVATPLELAMLVCELCGTYAISPRSELGMRQRDRPLTSIGQVDSFLRDLGGYLGAARLRSACGLAFELSASPRESALSARVAWPRARGGYAMPILALNDEVEVARISRDLTSARVRRPDILFSLPSEGRPGYCLDYHGGVHGMPGRREADSLRANELLAYGLQPFSIWDEQYQSTAYMDGLVDGVIRRALGLPAPRPRKERFSLELARREALLSELNEVDGVHWGTSDKAPAVLAAKCRVDEALDALHR